MLLTLEDQMPARPGLSATEVHAVQHWAGFVANGRTLPTETVDAVLTPVVNHGRWLVHCPDCPSANRASRVDHRFLCAECGTRWMRVAWPDDADGIDQALSVRPRPNRNWSPPETVADLLAENERMGL